MNFEIYLWSSTAAMADREWKGRDRVWKGRDREWNSGRKKYKYLNIYTMKSFFDEIKFLHEF